MEDIKALKLITGEEVITRLEPHMDNDFWVMHSPVRFIMVPTDAGMQLSMQPFVMVSDSKEFSILKQHILTISNPVEEIRNAWNAQFGSGIVTSSKSLVL